MIDVMKQEIGDIYRILIRPEREYLTHDLNQFRPLINLYTQSDLTELYNAIVHKEIFDEKFLIKRLDAYKPDELYCLEWDYYKPKIVRMKEQLDTEFRIIRK